MSDEWKPIGEPREIPGTRDYVPDHGIWGFVGLFLVILLYIILPLLFLSFLYCGFLFAIHAPGCF